MSEVITPSDGEAQAPQAGVEAVTATAAGTGLVNGDFAVASPLLAGFGWTLHGDAGVEAGVGVLGEHPLLLSGFEQTFDVPAGAVALHVTLVKLDLQANRTGPVDAFEVALLDARGDPTLAGQVSLPGSDALLNVQTGGRTWASPFVSVDGLADRDGGVLAPAGPVIVSIALDGVAAGTEATLSFDLLGLDLLASEVRVDDVFVGFALSSDGKSSTAEDTSLNGRLPGALETGVALDYRLVTDAAHGRVNVQADGRYAYAPDPDFHGTDTFRFRVDDSEGRANLYAVTLTVTPVNDAPTAANGSATVKEDELLVGQLPAASDVDGDSVVYALAAAASHGQVSVGPGGRYTYTPDPDYFGADGFTFSVSDGQGGSATYAMGLTVTDVFDPPPSWLAIARMGNAWFNGTFGNGTMLALQGTVDAFFFGNPVLFAAEVYKQYGSPFPTSTLAQSIANNLGLQGDANLALTLRIRDALDAITDPNPTRVLYLRGETLLAETERFTTLVDDPVYGEAARRFNAEIAAALKYAQIPGTLNQLTNDDGSPVELPEEPVGDGRVVGWAFAGADGAAVPSADPGDFAVLVGVPDLDDGTALATMLP